MSENHELRLSLHQKDDYAFEIRFEDTDLAELHTDEPAPLGAGTGPNPARLLLAAVGNCLSASLLFALRKYRNAPGSIHARVLARTERNAEGRWRIPKVWVEIDLPEGGEQYQHLGRILDQFEDFCVVTQSVRQGIDVEVSVRDGDGRVLLGDTRVETGS